MNRFYRRRRHAYVCYSKTWCEYSCPFHPHNQYVDREPKAHSIKCCIDIYVTQLLGMVRTLANDLGALNVRINLMCPFWTDTGIFPPGLIEKSASAKRSMQPAIACSHAVAFLGLDASCQGRVIYAASSTYTDLESGLYKTRPLWMGEKNHLDRVVWEEDPIVEFKTPL